MKANVKVAAELMKLARSLVAESDLEDLQKWARYHYHFGNGHEYKVKQVESGKFQLLRKNGEPQELAGTKLLPMSNIPSPHGEWENVFDYNTVYHYLKGAMPYGKSPESMLYSTLLGEYLNRRQDIKEGWIRSISENYGFEEKEVRDVLAELVKDGEAVFDSGVWRRP